MRWAFIFRIYLGSNFFKVKLVLLQLAQLFLPSRQFWVVFWDKRSLKFFLPMICQSRIFFIITWWTGRDWFLTLARKKRKRRNQLSPLTLIENKIFPKIQAISLFSTSQMSTKHHPSSLTIHILQGFINLQNRVDKLEVAFSPFNFIQNQRRKARLLYLEVFGVNQFPNLEWFAFHTTYHNNLLFAASKHSNIHKRSRLQILEQARTWNVSMLEQKLDARQQIQQFD